MYFDATPGNMTIMLVVALAIIAIVLLMKGHYNSNLPLLYFSAAAAVNGLADGSLSPYLLYSGIACALILRFEFMGKGFTKFMGAVTWLAIGMTAVVFLDHVLGNGRGFF